MISTLIPTSLMERLECFSEPRNCPVCGRLLTLSKVFVAGDQWFCEVGTDLHYLYQSSTNGYSDVVHLGGFDIIRQHNINAMWNPLGTTLMVSKKPNYEHVLVINQDHHISNQELEEIVLKYQRLSCLG